MKFGIFIFGDNHPELGRSNQKYYQEVLNIAEWAEELGFDSFWLGEHQLYWYGTCVSPPMLIAALGQRTKLRLRPAFAGSPVLALAMEQAPTERRGGAMAAFPLRIGIGYSLVATFTLQSLALILLVTAANLATILCAGVLYMLGMAIGGSATLIIAMKRATPERRGRFMAAFSIAYPLGYGVGAFITGSAVEMIGYSWTYLLLAALGLSGLVLTLVNWSELQ